MSAKSRWHFSPPQLEQTIDIMASLEFSRACKHFLAHALAIASLTIMQVAHGATQYINENAPAPLEIAVMDDGTPGVWVAQPNNPRVPQYFAGFSWMSQIRFTSGGTTRAYENASMTPVSNATTGTGTMADPFVITTVLDLGTSGLRLRQRFSYVNGDRNLRKTWSLTNSSETLYEDVRFFHGGDTTFGGIDAARAWFDDINAMVYVTNSDFTNQGFMGFYANPATPSAGYFGGHYGTGYAQAYAGELSNTADSNYVDAGYQLQWNRAQLAPGQTWTFEGFETWTPPGALQVLTPADDYAIADSVITKTFKVHNLTNDSLLVNLSVAADPNHWEATLLDGATVELPALGVAAIPVQVAVPEGATPGTAETITLTATSGSATGTGATRLTILETDYTISPAALDFGAVSVGTTVDRTVTLSNAATGAPVQIGEITVPAPYSLASDECSNSTVGAGESCSIVLELTLSVEGAGTDTVSWPIVSPVITTHALTASYVASAGYLVTTSATAGGEVTPANATVVSGATTSFTVTPSAGYRIVSVSGCSGTLSGNVYTTGNIGSACAVNAVFARNTYQITANATAGGAISPASTQVSHGATTSFTVTPSTGYRLVSVSGCSGTLSGNVYTTGNVGSACAVNAVFNANTYQVTASATAGGTISPASTQVSHGATTAFTVTANVGYRIDNVSGCAGTLNGDSFTTAAVTANCTVSANFARVAPSFASTVSQPITIQATHLAASLPTNAVPQAHDTLGNPLTVTLDDARQYYPPGEHVLVWRTVDQHGIESTAEQILRVWPTVSMGKDVTVGYEQGSYERFKVVLNGLSPVYPFTVSYIVEGANDSVDLADGIVEFAQGETEKDVFFAVLSSPASGTPNQEIRIVLADDVNRGKRDALTITLATANVAPTVTLVAAQDDESRTVFGRDAGEVTIVATIRDPNSNDTHTVQWQAPSGAAVETAGDTLILQADSLPVGVHRFDVVVVDSGSPSLATRGRIDIVLRDSAPVLPAGSNGWLPSGLPNHPSYAPVVPNVLPEREGEVHHYLIEADPGVRLALGPNVALVGQLQSQLQNIADAAIGADSVTNVGGYFDFVVNDLPVAGQSVNIVIPQREAIPERPVYRKYDPGNRGWFTFVENSSNALASAPGSAGFCPPPGSGDYRPGLNAGDWCVRLTIEDGGPNDIDNEVNGTISDPGGVASLSSTSVRTEGSGKGSGGGGSFSVLLLVSGFALWWMRRRLNRAPAVVAALAATVSVNAAANDDRAWYASAQLGEARSEVSTRELNARVVSLGYDATAQIDDRSRTAFTVRGGYQWWNHVALEAGYTDLGDVTTTYSANVVDVDAFLQAVNRVHPQSARGFEAAAVGRYTLGERFEVNARAGVFAWESKYTSYAGGARVRLERDGSDVLYGIGARYRLTQSWSLGADWSRYEVADERIDLLGLSVVFRIR